ncbi:prolipoprotein diacylglyceryl transferase family protein [Ruminococcus sp.]|uniref:prolipoprotein diacylglyceryl transferase family protein n=1 Tax=Ruminococcus sp. TaxID=41978 RepID=UPI0025D1FF7D|nr:prolipoprotein diacylglyceryl transferase family protein [Ruminococcus sp.]MCR4639421.1 prolipoprotein diacylglyceryl transferase [Ruminococcus sp.]
MRIHIDTTYSLIPPYVVMIVAACAVGIVLQYFMNVKRGIDRKTAGFVALLSPFMSLFFGLLLTYVSSGGKSFGLSSVGGLFGMYGSVLTLALIIGDKEKSGVMFENCTFALPLMYSVSKLGCLFAGCCHGRPYSGPFSVEYTGKVTETGEVFPVQLSESVIFFLIFAAGIIMFAKGSKAAVYAVFIASAAAKGLLDFTRESHIGKIVSLNQILCLLLIVVCIVCLIVKKRKTIYPKEA